MDLSAFVPAQPAVRHDGWSPELKIRFLDHLSVRGNVRAACAAVRLSHEAAYRLRRRDALFARGWNAALALARENGADVLGCRAIDGVVEEVWHRGELAGTRVRYDTRLLLAHMARLDRLVEQSPAGRDARRFDELLALIGQEQVPEELGEDRELPPGRDSFATLAAREAKIERFHAEPDPEPEDDDELLDEEERWEIEEDRRIAIEEACEEAARGAAQSAAALWDEWFTRACAAVDDALGEADFSPRTPSTVSTSAGACVELTPSPEAGFAGAGSKS